MTDWNNKEEVLEAFRDEGLNLEYASERLRADKEVLLAAISQNINALKYASEELKNNPPNKQGSFDLYNKPNSLKIHKSAIKRYLQSF